MIKYKHINSPIEYKEDVSLDSQTNLLQLKEWKSRPTSSNVDRISYQDETKELVVKFNDGNVYTYFDVDFAEFLDLINGQGICRTTGSNQYGSWYLGKYPSVGAALYRLLVRRGKTYKKGGKI